MSKADEMLRVYHAFNEEYFKVGQLVEVTVKKQMKGGRQNGTI